MSGRPVDVVERVAPATDKSEVARHTPAWLILGDGHVFEGFAIGAVGTAFGEVVFNTAMTGYQEVLTDPSYRGQLVTMTCPHIGNYGIQPNDGESGRPRVAGLIVRKLARHPSHEKHVVTVGQYLANHGISGIEGLDTRALVKHVRTIGAQPAVITTDPDAVANDDATSAWAQRAVEAWGVINVAMGATGGAQRPYDVNPREHGAARGTAPLIVAYDFGIKEAILRQLASLGCRLKVVPPDFPADSVRKLGASGVFLSNGPGDPRQLEGSVDIVRALLGELPIFGICLGHQILALALGARVEKMEFGHRGANQPVLDLISGNVEITSQNHGYAVVEDSVPPTVTVSHRNLNDGSVEGISADKINAFSVQYHPEACPGPHDAHYHFDRFVAKLTSPA